MQYLIRLRRRRAVCALSQDLALDLSRAFSDVIWFSVAHEREHTRYFEKLFVCDLFGPRDSLRASEFSFVKSSEVGDVQPVRVVDAAADIRIPNHLISLFVHELCHQSRTFPRTLGQHRGIYEAEVDRLDRFVDTEKDPEPRRLAASQRTREGIPRFR